MQPSVEIPNGPCWGEPTEDQSQTNTSTTKSDGSRGADTVVKPKR